VAKPEEVKGGRGNVNRHARNIKQSFRRVFLQEHAKIRGGIVARHIAG